MPKKFTNTGLGSKTEVKNLQNIVDVSEVDFKKNDRRDGKYTLWKLLFADTPQPVISIAPN